MRVNIVVNSMALCCVAVSVRTSTYDRSFFFFFFAATELMQNLTQQKWSTFEDIILYIFSETCYMETRIFSKLLHWYISIQKSFQHVSSYTRDHHQGINTRATSIEECTSLSSVNLKFTFQSELQ